MSRIPTTVDEGIEFVYHSVNCNSFITLIQRVEVRHDDDLWTDARLEHDPPVDHAAQLLIWATRKLCVYRITVEVGGKGLLSGVEEPNAARVPSVDDAARLNERARGGHQGGDVEGKRRRPACSHPRLGQPMPLTEPPQHAADL